MGGGEGESGRGRVGGREGESEMGQRVGGGEGFGGKVDQLVNAHASSGVNSVGSTTN